MDNANVRTIMEALAPHTWADLAQAIREECHLAIDAIPNNDDWTAEEKRLLQCELGELSLAVSSLERASEYNNACYYSVRSRRGAK
jgi:hypothetical protein